MSKRQVHIFDTTLRDGEQSPGASLFVEEKVRIAHQLEKLGVDTIEPGFPASSPGDFDAVQRISRNAQEVEICGFARAVKSDIDAAVKATADAPRRRLHLFISSSQIHLDFQLRKSQEQVLQMARDMVAYGKQFVDEIEFSPMDATRTGEAFLFEMVEAVIEEGATIINIPDTVGYALPEEYGRIFRRVQEEVRGGKSVAYSAHCHNDLGMAVANSLAAIQAGATHIEATVNGIGERSGNCSLEELAMAIETRQDALGVETKINSNEIYRTSQMVSHIMNVPIAHNKPIVGRNAFQHEAGIHQDGLLKNRETYEIMNPDQMGIPRNMIILGKHSGRHALKNRIEQFGVQLSTKAIDDIFVRFKEIADKQKYVTDHQLLELVGDAYGDVIEAYTLVDMQVMASQRGNRVAAVTIRDNRTHTEQSYASTGKGPVEALIRCMKEALHGYADMQFEDLELYSLAAGETANGEAIVTISVDGQYFRGTSVDQDITLAVASAFLAAYNQAIQVKNTNTPKADRTNVSSDRA